MIGEENEKYFDSAYHIIATISSIKTVYFFEVVLLERPFMHVRFDAAFTSVELYSMQLGLTR